MPTKSRRSRSKTAVVQFAVARRGLPSAASFRRWAAGFPGITLRIVGGKEGRLLNRRYRGKTGPTNVLTFATGDVVLCDPVIRKEARRQGKSLAAHYAHLVVHGALHWRGHDHQKKRETERMERTEVKILRRLGFGNPYELE